MVVNYELQLVLHGNYENDDDYVRIISYPVKDFAERMTEAASFSDLYDDYSFALYEIDHKHKKRFVVHGGYNVNDGFYIDENRYTDENQ